MRPNKIERFKAELKPCDYAVRMASLQWDALSEADRFYLKNYGIHSFAQRSEYFFIRLRFDGGRIAPDALLRLCDIAERFNARLLLTARAQIELHSLDPATVYGAYLALQAAGFETRRTLTDNVRAIVTHPLEGEIDDAFGDATVLVDAMREHVMGRCETLGMLPRKFNTAVTSVMRSHVSFFGNDLFFAPAKKEGVWGFNVYVGGKNTETARSADIFVVPEEAPALFASVLDVFDKYGARTSRAKLRLFFMLETMGIEEFRARLEEAYGKALANAGTLHWQKAPVAPFTPMRNGKYAHRYQTRYGAVDVDTLRCIAQKAQEENLRLRLGVDQQLYVLDLPQARFEIKAQRDVGYVTVCAGSRNCALSLWEMKHEELDALPLKRMEALKVRVGMSGCLKGCGRHHHADIGIVGLRTNAFGPTQKAARIYLGGLYSDGKAVARMIYPSVPLKHLHRLIDAILDEYEQSGEADFEAFSRRYLVPFSEGFVALWFVAKLYSPTPIRLSEKNEARQYAELKKMLQLPDGKEEGYADAIRFLTHTLWDDKDDAKQA
jgi:ferredoxin-nitrite reductase